MECSKINQIQMTLKDGIEITLIFKSIPGWDNKSWTISVFLFLIAKISEVLF